MNNDNGKVSSITFFFEQRHQSQFHVFQHEHKMKLCLSFCDSVDFLMSTSCKIPGYDDDVIESTELQELRTEPFMTNVNIGHMNWPSIDRRATLYLLETRHVRTGFERNDGSFERSRI